MATPNNHMVTPLDWPAVGGPVGRFVARLPVSTKEEPYLPCTPSSNISRVGFALYPSA